jgi:chitin disaccharide deacetylase
VQDGHAASGSNGRRPWYGPRTGAQTPSAPGPVRALAVCIDDYGLHAGIDAAAVDLAKRRRVTAISCMPDGPDWREGAAALRDIPAGTQLGLHLNLTEALGRGGLVQSLPKLVIRTYARALDAAVVRDEIRRQFAAFESGTARAPDFVDGHQHVHQLPVIREALIDVLDERAAVPRPWLRCTLPAEASAAGLQPADRRKSWLIGQLGAAALSRLAATHGYPQNRRLLGSYAFDGTEDQYLDRLQAWFAIARDGDLLMCHASASGPWQDPILAARVREYRVLAGPAVVELQQRCGIEIRPLDPRRAA